MTARRTVDNPADSATPRDTADTTAADAGATTDTTATAPARVGYGTLLRTPGVWTFLAPAFLARLPYAMLSTGILLLVKETHGSYGTASTVAAVAAVAQALIGPQTGRLADRYGQAAVLVPAVIVHALSVGALIALALGHAPAWSLFLAAVPAGASVPQIGAMVRARWIAKFTADGASGSSTAKVSTAFAFESVTDEFTFVIGPILTAAIATTISPSTGLIVEAALTVVGGLAFAAQRNTAPARQAHRPGAKRASALASPGVRLLAGTFLGVGAVFGGLQVSVYAFADSVGQHGAGGTVYGIFAGGSMVAGVLYGVIAWRRVVQQRMIMSYTLLVLGCSTLWAMPNLIALTVAGLVCGLAIAPTLISGYTLVETLVADGAKTEAFTWLTGAIGLGLAVGSMAAGRLIDGHGPSVGFLVPLAGAGLGLVALVSLRHLLTASGPANAAVTASPERAAAPQLVGAAKG
ncbi:MFS family permease [Kitasatospora sp. MAA19]|uniref:MFS transporter n=1 Tax=unclassified Kitasatospora TaxID=2633591 RepID=UPI002474CBAB|nr:MFS transporter [Kitasatospora sp. MAA19]MDH6706309.1 MFS family permease [Kitasatospora sp. MAA19]